VAVPPRELGYRLPEAYLSTSLSVRRIVAPDELFLQGVVARITEVHLVGALVSDEQVALLGVGDATVLATSYTGPFRRKVIYTDIVFFLKPPVPQCRYGFVDSMCIARPAVNDDRSM